MRAADAFRSAGRGLVVAALPGPLAAIFQVLGLARLVSTAPSLDAALAALAPEKPWPRASASGHQSAPALADTDGGE